MKDDIIILDDDFEDKKSTGIDIMVNTAISIYQSVSTELDEVLTLKKQLRDSLIADIPKMTPNEKLKFHDKVSNEFLSIADINKDLISPKSNNGQSLLVSIQNEGDKKEDGIEELANNLTSEQLQDFDNMMKVMKSASNKEFEEE